MGGQETATHLGQTRRRVHWLSSFLLITSALLLLWISKKCSKFLLPFGQNGSPHGQVIAPAPWWVSLACG